MRETFGQGADWKRPHAFLRVTAAAQQIYSFPAKCRAEWPLFNPSMYRAGRQCGAVRLVSRVLQAVERMGCVARRICKAGAHGLKRDGQTCIAVTERVDRTQSINWIEQARRHGPLVTNLPLDVTLSRAHACRQASLPFPLRSLLPSSRHPSITSARAQANTCLSPHRGCL